MGSNALHGGPGHARSSALTGFFLHPSAALHDPGWGHPDHQGRLPAIASALGKEQRLLEGGLEPRQGRQATRAELRRVHDPAYLDRMELVCRQAADEGTSLPVGTGTVGPGTLETMVSGATWEAVLGSAGATIEAVESVVSGALRNGFVASRPPGHHAMAAEAGGFCIVNHVAVAARHLLETGRVERVAIVDWGTCPGRGTREIFSRDPAVRLVRFGQSPQFSETDFPARFLRSFREVVRTARDFVPDIVLISASYDELAGDPVRGGRLEPEHFCLLTREVLEWAERVCQGRVVGVLEGGYEPRATAEAVIQTVLALVGIPSDDVSRQHC